ncbi:MAG: RNA 2',3'-cyclic phosphodiesterase [Candidatus Nanoarchaeia archaeon]
MRCFIALTLPDDVKDYLYNLQKELKTKDAKINWTAKKNLHLTLKFFGELKEEQLEQIKKRLEQIKAPSINVNLNKIGFFPDEVNPHVIWIGLTPEKEIIDLARMIDEETLDLSSGEQKFTAHLTLGRVKQVLKTYSFDQVRKLKLEKMSLTFTSFTLYQSTLSTQGPTYKQLATYPLQ